MNGVGGWCGARAMVNMKNVYKYAVKYRQILYTRTRFQSLCVCARGAEKKNNSAAKKVKCLVGKVFGGVLQQQFGVR